MKCRLIVIDFIKIPPFLQTNERVGYRIWIGYQMAKRVGVMEKDIFEWQ
jgi:hypothetical protein